MLINPVGTQIDQVLRLFIIIGIAAAISLYVFAFKKRKAEIKSRGYSRIGIIRRYFAFILGGDWLLGR